MRKLVFAAMLLSASAYADSWSGSILTKQLGAIQEISSSDEKNEIGLMCHEFEPAKTFLSYESYLLWVTPVSKQVAAIVAVAEVSEDDDNEAKLLARKTLTLLKNKFPEARETAVNGVPTLVMGNGDKVNVEILNGCVRLCSFRASLISKGVSEARSSALKTAGVTKGEKWTGELLGKKLGDVEAIPEDAIVLSSGLSVVEYTPKSRFLDYTLYTTRSTLLSKKIAEIMAYVEVEDQADRNRIRNTTAAVLKAKFPESDVKTDEDGDVVLTFRNQDKVMIEADDEGVILVATRPALRDLGAEEFKKKSVEESKSDLDAL